MRESSERRIIPSVSAQEEGPNLSLYSPDNWDLDACDNEEELLLGMDPTSPWNIFEVHYPPDGISGLDIFAVIARFNTKEGNGYSQLFDRSPGYGPPDGSISALDIFMVIGQFGFECESAADWCNGNYRDAADASEAMELVGTPEPGITYFLECIIERDDDGTAIGLSLNTAVSRLEATPSDGDPLSPPSGITTTSALTTLNWEWTVRGEWGLYIKTFPFVPPIYVMKYKIYLHAEWTAWYSGWVNRVVSTPYHLETGADTGPMWSIDERSNPTYSCQRWAHNFCYEWRVRNQVSFESNILGNPVVKRKKHCKMGFGAYYWLSDSGCW